MEEERVQLPLQASAVIPRRAIDSSRPLVLSFDGPWTKLVGHLVGAGAHANSSFLTIKKKSLLASDFCL
ncbi:MAG: hypothetical protein WD278_06985, partial [Pirellulales bacterium]